MVLSQSKIFQMSKVTILLDFRYLLQVINDLQSVRMIMLGMINLGNDYLKSTKPL